MLSRMRTTTFFRGLVAACAGVAIAAGIGHSVSRVQAQAADTLTVYFLAVGPDGKPVADLTAAQVSIKIDGKDRAVRALKFVQPPAAGAAAPAASAPAGTLPAPFATNAAGDPSAAPAGRLVIIWFDEESITPGIERPVRAAVGQFLSALSPADRVSFAAIPKGAVRVEATTAHNRISDALGQVVGRHSASESTDDRACRARDTLLAMQAMLNGLGAVSSPTTVLLISAAMPGPNSRAGNIGDQIRCELTTTDFQRVGTAAEGAHAQFFVVQPDTSSTTVQEGLENLAGVTGGQVVRLSSGTNPLGRIASETSAYYVATIAADAADRNAQAPKRLEVRVAGDGVTVRARSQITVGNAAAAAARPASGKSPADTARDLLKASGPATDLPLRVAAFASRGTGGKIQISAIAETVDPATKLAAASFGILEGTQLSSSSADQRTVAAAPLMLSVLAAPGSSVRARFTAVDASGKSGAVDVPVTADLVSAGPLKLSGLVLGTTKGGFVPSLQFKDEATIVAYLELYGDVRSAPLSARIEIAPSADGPALATVQPGGRTTSEPDKFLLTGDLPIGSLAPGDYVVRAIVGLQGQPEGTVLRTLRKTK